MKQLSVTIEHRKFNLNIQDEYYDRLSDFLSDDINLHSNNLLSDILSLCIKNSIEIIDLKDDIKKCLDKIDDVNKI